MKTPCIFPSIPPLALAVILQASLGQAQQPPPLPPGYVYQISKTNGGDGPFLTAEALKLPPVPPGFGFRLVPEPTNEVDTITELFEQPTASSTLGDPAPEPGLKRSRTARLNDGWRASRSDKFLLNLFDDATFTAVVERTERTGSSLVRFCRLEGKPQSRLIVAEHNGVIAASVLLPGENWYAIRYEGNGLHKIRELQSLAAKFVKPQCVVDLQHSGKADDVSIQPQSGVAGGGPEGSEPPIIDLMVIYTPATTAAHGGPDGVAALIALAVAEVNQVFANSLINAHLRLIHKQEVQYTESGDSNLQTDYDRLDDQADGYLDQVPGLGDAWGADLISLWLTHPNALQSRGEALTPTRPSKYSVVIARNATSTGSPQLWHFAHELGHNLGCDHSFDDNGGPTRRYFDDSLGNWQICAPPCGPSGFYADIMAFIGFDTLPYYSNPDVDYLDPSGGDPCPTGFPPTSDCPCDCAGTINVTAAIVAGYKTATFFIRPTFHSGTQRFTFDITGPPGAPCKIESSSDLAQWTVRQTLTLSGTGTGTFDDHSVGGVSHRFYRATP